jgi:hypothetical protein
LYTLTLAKLWNTIAGNDPSPLQTAIEVKNLEAKRAMALERERSE